MRPVANLLVLPGKNCHHETAYWFRQAGANARIILLNQVLKRKVKLSDCDLFILCGGFGWGDDIRSGVISALDLMYRAELAEAIEIMLDPYCLPASCKTLQSYSSSFLPLQPRETRG